MPRILIITEEKQNLNGIYSGLVQRGLDCSTVPANEDIIKQVRERAPDLVILGVSGQSDSGTTELLQKIKRARQLPVIALINRRIADRPDIDLEAVDDFIIDSGDAGELVLRIKRLLNRTGRLESSEVIRCGDLVIDLAKCEVSLRGQRIACTFKEYELLRFLASHPGRVYTRDSLLDKVWGYDYFGGDRTVDVHIRRLRSKIEDLGYTFIETVRNIGYRFNCNS
ncbi:MAG TPA: response regulator transcription factor [Dehalococcoidales bacterium]|nr:response regulator transcription factor [Dehalococcoidales bacterium]